MNDLDDDDDLFDEEANLRPEAAQAPSRVRAQASSRGPVGELMAHRVPVPLGLLLFLFFCMLALLTIACLHVRSWY